MVTDEQVRRLFRFLGRGKPLPVAAAQAAMDEKTARRYRREGRLASELTQSHAWRTRCDPFCCVWEKVREQLELNPGLQGKTLFAWLQREHPGEFQAGQLRSLQRRIRGWRATEGPAKEIYFAQRHEPGRLSASDFTHMTSLGVTIQGQAFPHLVYHFVLTCSNWETVTICFSESFESLSEGLQNGLWQLGGVPGRHRTDRLSAAVNNLSDEKEFTRRYRTLLEHYGLEGEKIQAGQGHENGDAEQLHRRLRDAVDQALMLRGSRDFESRELYAAFLRQVTAQLNAGRQARLDEERAVLRPLPPRRLESHKRLDARVDSGSLIHVDRNTYSVDSRLCGERVQVRLFVEHLEVWYAQKLRERIPRLRGRGGHHIQYRHIIDWLVRKPGAFENYRYRAELFPTSRFRVAYDVLRENAGRKGTRVYLEILQMAARDGESVVDDALRLLLDREETIRVEAVRDYVRRRQEIPPVTEVELAPVDLSAFDELLGSKGEWDGLGDRCAARPDGLPEAAAPVDVPGVL